jgi:hypothetical protein
MTLGGCCEGKAEERRSRSLPGKASRNPRGRRQAPFPAKDAGTGFGMTRLPDFEQTRICAAFALLVLLMTVGAGSGAAYSLNYAVPASGGCPVPTRMATTPPISRQWSTSLPTSPQTIFTVAAPGTSQQVDEIQQTILDAFSAWTGVSGTTLDATTYPSALAPLGQTATQDACMNDQGTNLTGQNTICFNQSSAAFTTGVLAFTRVFAATAPGQTVGTTTSTFTGQILEADILVRNDGQVTFATPGALASNPNSYDLESILIHELGHLFGLEHSPIWRAVMSPFAPAPGALSGSKRFELHRSDYRARCAGQSDFACRHRATGRGAICDGNFWRECGCGRCGDRAGGCVGDFRLVVPIGERNAGVRWNVSDRRASPRAKLQFVHRATRRELLASRFRRKQLKSMLGERFDAMHEPAGKHRFRGACATGGMIADGGETGRHDGRLFVHASDRGLHM